MLEWIEITLIVLPVFMLLLRLLDFGEHVAKAELLPWFAILLAVNLQTSFLTPPFGITLFYMKRMAPSIPMQALYRGIVPFVALQLIGLLASSFSRRSRCGCRAPCWTDGFRRGRATDDAARDMEACLALRHVAFEDLGDMAADPRAARVRDRLIDVGVDAFESSRILEADCWSCRVGRSACTVRIPIPSSSTRPT